LRHEDVPITRMQLHPLLKNVSVDKEVVMSCIVCHLFPSPTSAYQEIAVSAERHGTLYVCNNCGSFIEMIDEERSVSYLTREEASRCYRVPEKDQL